MNCEHADKGKELEVRDKIEVTLIKLSTLKSTISDLRLQCEELRKMKLRDKDKILSCSECGNTAKLGEEIVIRNSAGTKKNYYHKKCFQALWL